MIFNDNNVFLLKPIVLKDPDNPIVYLDLKIGSSYVGRVIIELFKHAVPSTAENFRSLCTGECRDEELGKSLHYKGSFFHTVIPHFMFQGGDIVNYNGTSGYSIYGPKFELENFTIDHDEPGMLSTVTTEEIYCNSQFIITTTDCPHLNGRSVAFGRVVRGFSCVQEMGQVETINNCPQVPCQIVDCGQLPHAYLTNVSLEGGLPHSPNDLQVVPQLVKHQDLIEIIDSIVSPAKSCFVQRNFSEAKGFFQKAVRYIEWLQTELPNFPLLDDQAKDMTTYLKEQLLKTQLNLAGTHIELGDTKKCEQFCDLVLASDSKNVKALYRKGRALLLDKDYEAALAVQTRAQALKPSDPSIEKAIQEIRKKKASYLLEEKRVFSKMFAN